MARKGTIFRCGAVDGMAYVQDAADPEAVYVLKAQHFGSSVLRFPELALRDGDTISFVVSADGVVQSAFREEAAKG
jgi:hypothetical protein